jgi:hypothetical protein
MTDWLDRLESRADDLVEEHSGETQDLSKYRTDPLGFFTDVLKCTGSFALYDKQEQLAELVRDHSQVSVASCNGAGKDFAAAAVVLWWVYACGGRALLMSATEHQVREILMLKEIRGHFARSGLPGKLFQSTLRLPGSDEARVETRVSKEASHITGFHGTRVLVVLSEAQGVGAEGWEAMLRCAVGAEDRMLCYGNPESPSGAFFYSQRPSSAWTKLRISAYDLPTIKGERDVPGLLTPTALERFRREYGEGSREWCYSIEGVFPTTSTDALIEPAWRRPAVERCHGPFRAQANGQSYVLSLDVARFGGDDSALAIWQGPVLVSLEAWHGADLMESAGRVAAKCAELGIRKNGDMPPWTDPVAWGQQEGRIVIDSTGAGMGKGVVDRLRELHYDVEEFDFSGKAPAEEGQRWANQRAWASWKFRTALKEGTVAVPDDEWLWDELLALRYTFDSREGLLIRPKKEIRKALGRSPDRSDAVIMGFAIGSESCSVGGTTDYIGF